MAKVVDTSKDFHITIERQFGYAMSSSQDPVGGDDGTTADMLVHAKDTPLQGDLVRELTSFSIFTTSDAVVVGRRG